MSQKITIRDVANQAGVSVSTVSLALSGKSGVSESLRAKITQIASDLGYQPNQMASSLKRKTRNIVVFLPGELNDNKYYYPPMWKGIRDFLAGATSMKVECTEIPYSMETSAVTSKGRDRLMELLREKKVDGILTAGHMNAFTDEIWEDIHKQGIAVVLVGADNPASKRICYVGPDYDVIGRTMAECILSHIAPYGSIVLNSGNPDWEPHSLVAKGFLNYMKENHASNKVYCLNNWNVTEEDYLAIKESLMQPDVAASCSVLARGSYLLGKALEETGRGSQIFSIGSDLFEDNIRWLNQGVYNNLVEKNPYAQGYLGIRRLTEYLLQNKLPEQDKVYVGSKVVFCSSLRLNDHQNDRAILY